MRGDAPIIVTVVLLYASATYFGVIVPKYGLPSVHWETIISSLIAATLGAVSGAFAAFRLEERRRKGEQVAVLVSNGNRTLIDLFAIWNNLVQYRRDVIADVEDEDPAEHWYRLKPTIVPYTAENLLDPSRYEFLLGTDGSQIAADILMELQRYSLFLWQVQERSRIMRELVRPRWEKAQLGMQRPPTHNEIIDVTGPNYYSELSDMTTNIKNFIEEDIESSKGCFDRLREHLVARFPGQKFIAFNDQTEGEDQADQ